MSEEKTQLLLVTKIDRLIFVAEETSTRLENIEGRLQNVEGRLQNMEERIENLEAGQAALKAQFENLDAKVENLDAKVENLDAKIEKRLHDTRPIWESVQTHLASLDARVGKLETDTASGFRGIDRKIGVLSKNLVDMTAEIRELQDRVEPHPV